MKKSVEKLIKDAVASLQKEKKFPDFDLFGITVDYSKNEKFGDYTSNIAMVLAKSSGKNPVEMAKDIVAKLGNPPLTPPLEKGDERGIFEKIEIVKPGYINFYLSEKYLQNVVNDINKKQEKFGDSKIGEKSKVNNEFISANPTGPLHIGNGRGGYYGDVISNVLRKVNFEVVNEYYVNNAGEQTLKLAHSFKKDDRAVYTGEYINELRDKHEEIINMDVQPSAAPLSAAVMSDYIKPAIEKMKIKIDHYTYEKDLYDNGEVDEGIGVLKNKNLTYEKDGATWLKTTKYGDNKDRVLIKSDGQKTYIASDCGYILNKIERGFNKIIEIWGADHHGYVTRFKAVAQALGFKGDLRFIIVQLVKLVKDGKEVRMSKRTGNVVYIDDLIKEVGNDVARFFFLIYSPDTHMNFDLDLAKEKSEKNPVYYVQYAHARICSILRKAEESGIDSKNADLSKLTHEKELSLIKELNKFPELVEEISESYEVHKLPHYAIKLADKFHSFYDKCRVINEDDLELSRARHRLINAVRIVLLETLGLMGVSAPEQM